MENLLKLITMIYEEFDLSPLKVIHFGCCLKYPPIHRAGNDFDESASDNEMMPIRHNGRVPITMADELCSCMREPGLSQGLQLLIANRKILPEPEIPSFRFG